MKSVLALFLFVAAASAAEIYEVRLLGNHLEDLVTQTLEYIRALSKKHDPYTLPTMPDQTLVDTDINLVFSGSNVEVSKGSDFTIDTIKCDPLKLTSQFGVTIPVVHQQGNYKISGTGWGKKVEGSGTFTLDVTHIVQTADIQYAVVDHSLQIKDLTLGYDIGTFKLSVTGLTIEGFTQDEINDLLNKKFVDIINKNKPFVEEHAAEHTKEVVNRLLKGHSLADVIAWLEQLVASTPDPPPFTFGP